MEKNRVVLFGAGGQLGSRLRELLGSRCLPVTRREVDLSNPIKVAHFLENLNFKVIINAAAFTDVEAAETERSTALALNSVLPATIAQVCLRKNACLVHYSTDFVFSGTGEMPWTETAAPAPVNFYGYSKLLGEQEISASGCRNLIFRTSWIFDSRGNNFLIKILQAARLKTELSVVQDQLGCPTYAPDLARASLRAMEAAEVRGASGEFPSGIYHLCNSGPISRYAFAVQALELGRAMDPGILTRTLHPVTSDVFPSAAIRPKNSRLDTSKAAQELGVELPPWKSVLAEAVRQHLKSRGEIAA